MKDEIRISFVGDLMCAPCQLTAMKGSSHTFDEVFAEIGDVFKGADYVVGNLETPLAGAESGYSTLPAFFNTPDDFAKSLKNAGIDFVTTANNHCMDRGVSGLNRTLDTLDSIGIRHTGTYRKHEEAQRIEVVEIKGVKFAFVAATYGYNSEDRRKGVEREILSENDDWRIDLLKKPVDPSGPPQKNKPAPSQTISRKLKKWTKEKLPRRLYEAISILRHGVPTKKNALPPVPQSFCPDCVNAEDFDMESNRPFFGRFLAKIRRAKTLADIVVVLPHVGGQYNPVPGGYLKRVIREILNCGVDLIVANHSHNPLPLFISRQGTLVANSLGNFCCTPGREWFVYNSLGEYGVVLNVYFDKRTKSFSRYDFAIVKSVVESDGFARTITIDKILKRCATHYERDKVLCEADRISALIGDSYAHVFEKPEQ